MDEIRPDLKEVDAFISRLLAIGRTFSSKDQNWSHLKNKEDWDRNIYLIKDSPKKARIEDLYCNGRDIALYMSDALLGINYDISRYPTLTSVIDGFKNSWVYSDLDYIVENAQQAHDELGLNCWAFDRMTALFKDQQELLKVVRQTLDLLKESNLYKKENGLPTKSDTANITFGNVTTSNITIGSENVTQCIKDSSAVFSQLREAIQSSDIEDKQTILKSVDEMESVFPGNGFTQAYKNFMSFAADHITVFAPYLSALSSLL